VQAREFLSESYDTYLKERWLFILNRPAVCFASQLEPQLGKRAERLTLPVADNRDTPVQILGVSAYSYDSLNEQYDPIAPAPEPRYFDTVTLEEIPGPDEAQA
jgi:hypothetical protein